MEKIAILLITLFYGFKIIYGLKVLIKWDTEKVKEAIKTLGYTKLNIYLGLFENSVLLSLSIFLYYV